MASAKASLESNKVFLTLVVLSGVVGHDVLPQSPAEGQLLLEAILQQTVRPCRVFLPQIVYINDQSTGLLRDHSPDVGRVDSLVLLQNNKD